jgi:quinol monooxygenase YgiN
MIHETVHYTVPKSAVPACRQAIRELVEEVKEEEPETVLYTVLEDIDDEHASFLHLAAFENLAARERHHDSERLRMFVDLVYPATRDGIHFSEQKIVDRLPERLARVRR